MSHLSPGNRPPITRGSPLPPSSTSHHFASHHITSRHFTSHHITSDHITSHHITSHHITSHHITSHHLYYLIYLIYCKSEKYQSLTHSLTSHSFTHSLNLSIIH